MTGKSCGDNDDDDDESVDNVDAELFSDGIMYEIKEAETYSDEESCDSDNEFDLLMMTTRKKTIVRIP
jgi:hypothetical protein